MSPAEELARIKVDHGHRWAIGRCGELGTFVAVNRADPGKVIETGTPGELAGELQRAAAERRRIAGRLNRARRRR